MKKMSKITALMLALLLALGMVLPAYAGSVADVDIDTWNTWLEELKAKFPEMSVEEQYQYIMQLDDSAKMQLIDTLSQEQYDELCAYALSFEEPVEYKSIVFTNAGPFMPAVTVDSVRRTMLFAAKKSGLVDNEGIITSKTLSADGKTLRLESYVTGQTTVTTVTKTTPVDIVLVLDQSGSMASDFNGKDTNTNANRRQYAMKNAVNNFIDEVANKYSEQCDNRMSIVTFDSNAETIQNWTYVDDTGKATLQSKVSGLPNEPSGATNVAAGMEKAETLMGSGYSYTGVNTTRQKVVIVFTDGVPTTQSAFSTTVATNAIASAKKLKDGGVTVYSIGIFTGVNPDQLHGEKIDMALGGDTQCNGEVGSRWGASVLTQLFGDVRAIDIAAGNRFLNYLSSNFNTATEIGIKSYNAYTHSGWEITNNFSRTATGYYLTATDATSLNNIFQTISSNIQSGTASVQLDSNTVVKDVISDYFTLPTDVNTSGIKVYTALYKQDGTWGEDTPSTLVPTVTGNTVTVTGFDFSKNYCSTDNGRQDGNNDAAGNFYGRKLIIEIPIEVKDGFLGGNSVPTNGSNSGVYSGNTLVEQFTQPTVDMPVNAPEVTVTDKNVYLLATPTQEQLMDGAVVTIKDTYGNPVPNFNVNAENFGLETWQYEYVDLVVTKPAAITVPMTTDGEYKLSISMVAAGKEANPVEANGKINVFKPVLTFEDGIIDYNTALYDDATFNSTTDDTKGGYVSVVWKHGDTIAPEAMGAAPDLTKSYEALAGVTSGIVSVLDEVPMKVTVKNGSTDVTTYTTIYRKACDIVGEVSGEKCAWSTLAVAENNVKKPAFVLHVINTVGKLQISKVVEVPSGLTRTPSANDTFSFTVTLGTDADTTYTYQVYNTADNAKVGEAVTGFKSGETISLKAGQYALFENLLCNSTYKVSENDLTGTNYVQVLGDAEANEKTGKIQPAATVTEVYTNKYVLGTLTITKNGLNETSAEDYESAIFTVTSTNGESWTVVVPGGESVTLGDLPAGTYTVHEESDWSWRYGDVSEQSKIISQGSSESVTFTNSQNNFSWLGGDNFKTNVFGTGN